MEDIRISVECKDAWMMKTIPCGGEVTLTFCPYDEDVKNIQTPVRLCERHAYERERDI